MDRPGTLSALAGTRLDGFARVTERGLRVAGDPRLGIGLLLVTAGVNAWAAAVPRGSGLVATPPYLALLGALTLSGLAAVAVRAPVAWREWRRPTPVPDSRDALRASLEVPASAPPSTVLRSATLALDQAGYRVAVRGSGEAATLAGVRRGWSQFAGLGAHLALVLVVAGAGIGLAFGHETTFSLLNGEQALLDQPSAGFTDALRLDGFDAAFRADGRPSRLDTRVTFLQQGVGERAETLQVNSPGSFDGYLVHAWTYGPAVQMRATTLAGRPLLDTTLPLDTPIGGANGAFAELPTLGVTLGIALDDPASNALRITAADDTGVLDSTKVVAGGHARVGPVEVSFGRLTAYVTFLSRRDPGMVVLFMGGGLLAISLATAVWFPRRRASVRLVDGSLRLLLRGGRLDDAHPELERLRQRLAIATGAK
jgi:ResB-like family